MPLHQEHQNWTGGALNIIKLMGMKISFPKILGKLKKIKLSENMRNFENLKKKKGQNSAFYSTQWPPDNWPDALDCLAICLVANKCTKLGKITEKLLLKLPLPSTVLGCVNNLKSVDAEIYHIYLFTKYSRARNKRSPTIINFLTFFQGLRPLSGLYSIR